jgi:transposase InsO family protein
MSKENPAWGTPRIKSELLLLGHDVADSTIDKYKFRQKKPPSQTWRTFLKNHMSVTAACDFFVVYTVTFRRLFCFIIIRHDRRQIVHFNFTPYPSAEWTGQQIIEAFPGDGTEPRYLLHDRDSIYSDSFCRKVKVMGIEEVRTAYHCPWQNPYCERVILSLRRECLDRVIIFSEMRLLRIMKDYLDYYHHSRPHLSLERNSPTSRDIQPLDEGGVISIPMVGGLHHLYTRAG